MAELITLERPGKDFWIRTADDNYQMNFDELRAKVPKDCPPKFLELCLMCCAYNPEDRPDFSFIVKTLKEIEQQLPKSPSPASQNSSPQPQIRSEADTSTRSGQLPQVNKIPEGSIGDKIPASLLRTIRSLANVQLPTDESTTIEKHLKKMIVRAINPDFFGAPLLALN